MIRSFGDKLTEALFRDERVRQFSGIARVAKRKLEAVNAARARRFDGAALEPAGEAQGRPEGLYSIRINDQWRVIFKWIKANLMRFGLSITIERRRQWRITNLHRLRRAKC